MLPINYDCYIIKCNTQMQNETDLFLHYRIARLL